MYDEPEIWKSVPDYEGYYEVSSWGKFRSLDRVIISKNNRKLFYKGQILKLILNTRYLGTILCKPGFKNKRIRIHRIVGLVFVPNPDNKPYLNHLDGNVYNNYYKNFEWTTPKENVHHAIRIGLWDGKAPNQGHFTENQVKEFRKFHKETGLSSRKVAEHFCVNKYTMKGILNYSNYKNI